MLRLVVAKDVGKIMIFALASAGAAALNGPVDARVLAQPPTPLVARQHALHAADSAGLLGRRAVLQTAGVAATGAASCMMGIMALLMSSAKAHSSSHVGENR